MTDDDAPAWTLTLAGGAGTAPAKDDEGNPVTARRIVEGGAAVEGSGLASARPSLSGVLRRLEEAGELEEMGTLLAERIDDFAERRAEERTAEQHARGLEQGLEQERALLARQAARKFGAETAERLAALLGGIDDPERLAEIGEAVIDCADGAELLARAAAAGGSV